MLLILLMSSIRYEVLSRHEVRFPIQIFCQVNNNTYDIAFAQLYQDLHLVLGCPEWYNDFDLN